MIRSRTLAALLLTLGVLWAAFGGAGGAAAEAPAEPTTTITVSDPGTELARTGPRDDATGLSLFGFGMVGIGVITIVASRRLLFSEPARR